MRKMKFTFGLLLMLSLLFFGCVSTREAVLNPQNTRLEIYTSTLPQKPYTEIYYIQSDGAVFHTPQKLLSKLTEKAEILNADAIINVKYDFQGWYPIASATAIKYK